MAEHIVYSHPVVLMCILKLFNLILLSGYVPSAFGEELMIPLLKDKNADSSLCNNYLV